MFANWAQIGKCRIVDRSVLKEIARSRLLMSKQIFQKLEKIVLPISRNGTRYDLEFFCPVSKMTCKRYVVRGGSSFKLSLLPIVSCGLIWIFFEKSQDCSWLCLTSCNHTRKWINLEQQKMLTLQPSSCVASHITLSQEKSNSIIGFIPLGSVFAGQMIFGRQLECSNFVHNFFANIFRGPIFVFVKFLVDQIFFLF